jgi:hypothetical protein
MSLLRYICDFMDKKFLSLVHHMPLPTIQGWTILDCSISVTQFPSVTSGKSFEFWSWRIFILQVTEQSLGKAGVKGSGVHGQFGRYA